MALVVGTDGGIPIYDREGRWTIYALSEVYLGKAGKGKFVPKVNDYVRDPSTYETWIVDHLDPVTFIPTLRLIHAAKGTDTLTLSDITLGVGPGPGLYTYRAFMNTTVFPHTLALDQHWIITGSLSSYVKIFQGTDTTPETGKVVSKVYDASGQFVSDAVPLELIMTDSHVNYTAKSVRRCNTTEKFPNGEQLTAVVYADDGHVVERRTFLTEITDTIMDVTTPQRYIQDIWIKSMWLSPTEPNQLEFPLNIPMDALNMMGVVKYSDGSEMELPVNGTKFAMLGLEGRLSSVIGQPTNLVLRYLLGKSEYAYAANGANGSYITKPYRIITTNPNYSIAVKLFGYPFWVSDAIGYQIRWFLLNLERNVWFEVTDNVKWSDQTGPFNPKQYGYLQRKAVTINLRDVSGAFIPFIHSQVVDFYLVSPPNNGPEAAWSVNTEASDQYPRFGVQVYGKITGQLVNFSAGFTTLPDWLDEYYYRTRPLVDVSQETKAPLPTHFQVTVGNTTTTWDIGDWYKDLSISPAPSVGDTSIVKFIRRTSSGDLLLSIAAVMLKKF